VLPDAENEDAEEASVVLRDALKKTKKVGLGQLVIRGKSSIVALKACGKGLLIETLRYADEVKKADSFFSDIPKVDTNKELIGLAEELIGRKAEKFEPANSRMPMSWRSRN
jgi:DNA end-binding protein Ku